MYLRSVSQVRCDAGGCTGCGAGRLWPVCKLGDVVHLAPHVLLRRPGRFLPARHPARLLRRAAMASPLVLPFLPPECH